MIELHRVGWAQGLGHGRVTSSATIERAEIVYTRVVLETFRLSHAATLYLLQGASLSTIFQDAVVPEQDQFFSLVFAEPPTLYVPPPTLPRVVLAHVFERPVHLTPADALHRLFLEEMEGRGLPLF